MTKENNLSDNKHILFKLIKCTFSFLRTDWGHTAKLVWGEEDLGGKYRAQSWLSTWRLIG